MTKSTDKTAMDGAIKTAREKIMALMLLSGANHKRYAEVHNHLANKFTQGIDGYPKTIERSVRLLDNYKPLHPVQAFAGHQEEEDVAFVQ